MRSAGRATGHGPAVGKQAGFVLISVLLLMMGISALAASMMQNAKHAQISAQNHKNRIRAFYAADGLRSLLAQEVIDGNKKRYLDSSKAGEIFGEIWEGAGSSLGALRASMGGPPSTTVASDYLGSNWKYKANYGVRWRGYLTPPSNGNYTFFVRADDEGAFYLAPDDQPSNLPGSPIAWVESYSFSWPKSGSGISKPVPLKMGKRYYFEFLHVQGGGDGFGQVGWQGPHFLSERPIPGKRLSSVGGLGTRWDTAMVGNGRVRYDLKEAGPLVYSISTESVMGGAGDTTFRSPLNQILNMRGDNPKPPDSLWQRVIFYDMRADGSNPEFERPADFGDGIPRRLMVQPKGLRYTTENAAWFGLDSIGKPRRGPNPWFNCGVERWFTAWRPGWFNNYAYAGGGSDCSESASGSDRHFENHVFRDSILFLRRPDLGVNAYQFNKFGAVHSAAFVPVDGRGFGAEGRTDRDGVPHNYSFCMELHTQFEHTSGMMFDFNGDDDVWLYINDSLVLDIGFVHASLYESVNLDDLPLKFGETYPLDFFFCERQSTGSSIDLITNLPVLQVADKPASSWKRDYGALD